MNNLPTNKIKAIRVSKTSFKTWTLYGAIDQALKTTCQADAVRVTPLHLDDVHGEPVDVELWFNVTPLTEFDGSEEPNPAAEVLLQQQELRDQGLSMVEVELLGAHDAVKDVPHVLGVAVLTGPGGTDVLEDDENMRCVLDALLGNHEEA